MKHRFIACFLCIVLIIACSDDENEGTNTFTGSEFVGTWQLVAINVSEAIDANNDGSSSNNLLNEVDCLQGTLTIFDDLTWSESAVYPALISPITNDLYNVSCTASQNSNGNWGINSNGQIVFTTGASRTFTANGNRITENIGNDLPNVQSYVYEKQ